MDTKQALRMLEDKIGKAFIEALEGDNNLRVALMVSTSKHEDCHISARTPACPGCTVVMLSTVLGAALRQAREHDVDFSPLVDGQLVREMAELFGFDLPQQETLQ